MGPEDDLTGFAVEDEAEEELHAVLDRARKLRQNRGVKQEIAGESEKMNKLIQSLKSEVKEEPMGSEDGPSTDTLLGASNMILDATAEYCRGLGDIPTYGMAGNRADAVNPDELVDPAMEKKLRKEQRRAAREVRREQRAATTKKKKREKFRDLPEDEFHRRMKEHEESRGQWVTSKLGEDTPGVSKSTERSGAKEKESSDSEDSNSDSEKGPVLGGEADAGSKGGVGGALKLAMQKGYLEKTDQQKDTGVDLKHLEAKRYMVMDKQFHDIDDKYAKKLERMGAGSGPIRNFEEKSGYKPDVNITYTDEMGRHMDVKEAFRYQSWKFHGKLPGKKKIEKRARKAMETQLMTHMNSSDTPLGTLSKQLEKQQSLQTPYILLSGSGTREVGPSIKK